MPGRVRPSRVARSPRPHCRWRNAVDRQGGHSSTKKLLILKTSAKPPSQEGGKHSLSGRLWRENRGNSVGARVRDIITLKHADFRAMSESRTPNNTCQTVIIHCLVTDPLWQPVAAAPVCREAARANLSRRRQQRNQHRGHRLLNMNADRMPCFVATSMPRYLAAPESMQPDNR